MIYLTFQKMKQKMGYMGLRKNGCNRKPSKCLVLNYSVFSPSSSTTLLMNSATPLFIRLNDIEGPLCVKP